jgi:hypothetical protein
MLVFLRPCLFSDLQSSRRCLPCCFLSIRTLWRQPLALQPLRGLGTAWSQQLHTQNFSISKAIALILKVY